MTEAVIRIVAAVVLNERNHVLVVRKRGTSSFMQPGGKIEPGEEPLQALIREVAEELGAGVNPSSVRSLGDYRAAAANEPGHVVEAKLYLVSLDGEPHPAAEIEELAWVDPQSPGVIELAPLTRHTVLALVRS
ncbi:NUDIX domain-containing protein [Mycobacterium sp. 21AC1]|uniref:NUDIX hydrolase n=1 Tax=[Mycobacterium] appelbergii TaxID=2939269 RepID=UPI002938E6BB|nr:NUDIX domain-containing protein [Mycobacterium sp. 21AC1]MDV3128322.1 NUDIX domain-containing protein [Mycobacterium sp. 21AC1]